MHYASTSPRCAVGLSVSAVAMSCALFVVFGGVWGCARRVAEAKSVLVNAMRAIATPDASAGRVFFFLESLLG